MKIDPEFDYISDRRQARRERLTWMELVCGKHHRTPRAAERADRRSVNFYHKFYQAF